MCAATIVGPPMTFWRAPLKHQRWSFGVTPASQASCRRTNAPWLLAKHNCDAVQNGLDEALSQLTNYLDQNLTVDRRDERTVGNGILRQSGPLAAEQHVSRIVGSPQVTCQRHDDHGANVAAIEGIALHDHHWTAIARP